MVFLLCTWGPALEVYYTHSIFSPPPRNWISGGAPFPPEFAVFFGVYRCFYIFAPPRNWYSQNSPCGSKPCFTNGFQGFFIFSPPRNWIPMAPKRGFTKVLKPFHCPWRISCLKAFKPSGHNSGGCKYFEQLCWKLQNVVLLKVFRCLAKSWNAIHF